MVRGCLTAVGIAVALVGAFFVAAAATEFATGGDGKTSPGVYAGLIVIGGGLVISGAYLAWKMLARLRAQPGGGAETSNHQPAPPSDADRERQVLRFAESEHGRVTVAEVAAACDLTIVEAKTLLDRFVTLQVARMQVTQSGVLVYVFPGFMTDEEKARANDF